MSTKHGDIIGAWHLMSERRDENDVVEESDRLLIFMNQDCCDYQTSVLEFRISKSGVQKVQN